MLVHGNVFNVYRYNYTYYIIHTYRYYTYIHDMWYTVHVCRVQMYPTKVKLHVHIQAVYTYFCTNVQHVYLEESFMFLTWVWRWRSGLRGDVRRRPEYYPADWDYGTFDGAKWWYFGTDHLPANCLLSFNVYCLLGSMNCLNTCLPWFVGEIEICHILTFFVSWSKWQ